MWCVKMKLRQQWILLTISWQQALKTTAKANGPYCHVNNRFEWVNPTSSHRRILISPLVSVHGFPLAFSLPWKPHHFPHPPSHPLWCEHVILLHDLVHTWALSLVRNVLHALDRLSYFLELAYGYGWGWTIQFNVHEFGPYFMTKYILY